VQQFLVFARGLVIPMPGVFKGLDLRFAVLALWAFEEQVVVALAVEGRVELDEVHALVLQVLAHHVEVVAVVEGGHASVAEVQRTKVTERM